MTNRATLQALLNRVLEGEGPDRELDLRIARELFDSEPLGHAAGMKDEMLLASNGWGAPMVSWPHYTTSLDAALTLVPEGWRVNTADWSIPGVYSWMLRGPCSKYVTGADGWPEAGDDWFRTASAATPARALIAACLKARMEAQGE